MVTVKIPPEVPIWWEDYVVARSDACYRDSRIKKMFQGRQFAISKSAIHRIVCTSKKGDPPQTRESPHDRKQQPTPSRMLAIARKVKDTVVRENPATQRSIAQQVNVSQRTVGRIIRQNLGLVTHTRQMFTASYRTTSQNDL